MNTRISFICLLLSLLAAGGILAEEALIRLEVISYEKAGVMTVLNDPRLASDPAAFHKEVLKRRESAYVNSLTLQGALPFRMQKSGIVSAEVDAGGSLDKLLHINISVGVGKAGAGTLLRTELYAKAGTPLFLGTLEPPDYAKTDRIWLVFLHVQNK
jgi:hypothetical protein